MAKFNLTTSEGRWVLADEETGITLTFDAHRYNETQEISIPDGMSDVRAVARVMHEMGEYMFTRHYSLAYPMPKTELRWSAAAAYLKNYHRERWLGKED